MKQIFAALAFVLLALPASAQTAATATPDDRARHWLTLVDDGNYADAFRQMAASAKSKANEQGWADKTKAAREPLGAMSSRTLKDIQLSKTKPGMRDGQNATVRYDTSFAKRAGATETVVLVSEDGGWSAVRYSIN